VPVVADSASVVVVVVVVVDVAADDVADTAADAAACGGGRGGGIGVVCKRHRKLCSRKWGCQQARAHPRVVLRSSERNREAKADGTFFRFDNIKTIRNYFFVTRFRCFPPKVLLVLERTNLGLVIQVGYDTTRNQTIATGTAEQRRWYSSPPRGRSTRR